MTSQQARATIFVSGMVQGVGFRWWTRSRALELGLDGYARNLMDGRVEVCAQGERDKVESLETLLRESPSTAGRPGRVSSCTTQWGEPREDLTGFREA
ncbi:MAG: acylphosphatase [Mobilicoccus sp.]|nr:acylphosphatase [Mobilicoccus sp.]